MTGAGERIEWQVKVGVQTTTAVYEPAAARDPATLFVCAHGAGGDMNDVAMLKLARHLRGRGMGVVRFNFLYREKGARAPDPMPRLMECFAAVVLHARREMRPGLCIIGGRSMGGRAASMLAAEGFPCDALLLLAYPLHPAGKPEQRRDAHLARIAVPVLCLNGTRDNLCRRDLMDAVVAGLSDAWTMHWLEAADHGFHLTSSAGRSDDDVLAEIADVSARWRSGLARRS
jgi:predicted alpha/beta-hydrolase family hydrolase